MSNAILQQFASQSRVQLPTIPDNDAFELTSTPAATSHEIPRAADFYTLTAIDTIMEPTPDDALQIEIGGQNIQYIPLSLLDRVPGTALHRIPPNRFFQEIPMVALLFNRVKLRLRTGTPFRVFTIGRYVENPNRRQQFLESPAINIFQQITLYPHLSTTPTTRIEATIGFDGNSRGYILESPAIHTLRRFQLTADGHIRWDYGPEELLLIATQLTPTLLWVPCRPGSPAFPEFLPTHSVAEAEAQRHHFVGSLPQGPIDNLRFMFEFSEPQSRLNIYNLSFNQLNIWSGVARTWCTYSYLASAATAPSAPTVLSSPPGPPSPLPILIPSTDETTSNDTEPFEPLNMEEN